MSLYYAPLHLQSSIVIFLNEKIYKKKKFSHFLYCMLIKNNKCIAFIIIKQYDFIPNIACKPF